MTTAPKSSIFGDKIMVMDAKTIYKMMKPQLDLLEPSERTNLSKLIGSKPAKKVSCQHRKIFSLSKAKENLRKMCRMEMEREKLEQQRI